LHGSIEFNTNEGPPQLGAQRRTEAREESLMPRPGLLLCLPLCLLIACAGSCAGVAGSAIHPATAAQQDPSVADAVRQRLRDERESELADLVVSVDSDGTVRLSGRTYTLAVADRAVQIARTTPGVTRVRNDILALPETQR
jgi:hypothetical protein